MPRKPRPGTCVSKDCGLPETIAIRTTNSRDKDGLVHTIYGVASDAPPSVPGYCTEHGVLLAANLAALHTGVIVTTVVTRL